MKILLSKLNHLGDTLLLTPTIRFLRSEYPDARIDVLVRRGCEAMLISNPDVSRVIPMARPERSRRSWREGAGDFWRAFRRVALARYDFAFDLSDSDRAKVWIALSLARVRGINVAHYDSWKHRLLFNRFSAYRWGKGHQVLRDWETVKEVMELKGEPGPLRFHPRATEAEVEAKLPFLEGLERFVVVHPTSRWSYKQWLPERWAAVADHLHRRHGLAVVFTCGPGEAERETVRKSLAAAGERHFWTEGKTTIDELGWLIGRASLFLGVDTVAMHLAAALQTPIVTLFGPSSEWSWGPWQCPHKLVLGECDCKRTRKFICDRSKPYPCMRDIEIKRVIDAAESMFDERSDYR